MNRRQMLVTHIFSLAASLLATGALAQGGAAPAGPGSLAAGDGFGVRSADGNFVLRVRGGIQTDGRFFVGESGNNTIDQFVSRRIRSDIQATVFRDYDFRVYLDYAQSRVELLDAYANARFSPAVQVRVGRMKGPVGLERLQSVWATVFAERAYPTSLVPNRETGVQLLGTVAGGAAEYGIGVFNGVPDGSSTDGDDGDSKDVEGRLFVTPLRGTGAGPLEGLGVGVGFTIGDQNGTFSAPNVSTLRTAGRETFFRYRADATEPGTVVLRGRRTRISPQASWSWKSISAMGEYVIVDETLVRGTTSTDVKNSAWQAAATVVLTGEAQTFRGLVPARNFDRTAGTWGAIELAARVSGISVDEATFPTFANPATSVTEAIAYTGGINWYLNRMVRFLINYEHTDFTPAPGGTDRPSEDVIIGRLQFAI